MIENLIGETHRPGRIEVVCGSMFSGKTEELIRRLKRAKIARQQVMIFKPVIDTRYSTPVKDPQAILKSAQGYDVIGIDEAQFFDDSLVEVCNKLAYHGMRIIVTGLDMDYLGQPFGPMPKLLAIADEVTKVHAICVKCGSLAYASHRLVRSNAQVMLGEKDEYEPLCRDCFKATHRRDSEFHLSFIVYFLRLAQRLVLLVLIKQRHGFPSKLLHDDGRDDRLFRAIDSANKPFVGDSHHEEWSADDSPAEKRENSTLPDADG